VDVVLYGVSESLFWFQFLNSELRKRSVWINAFDSLPQPVSVSCCDDALRSYTQTNVHRSLAPVSRLPYLQLNYVSRPINHPATPLLGRL
jgi:hypothetical protein